MKLLGIDYGEKKVGVALSDDSQKIAFPHSVLKNDKKLLINLEKICSDNEVRSVVVGESRDLSGQPNAILKDIYSFKAKLEEQLGQKVYLVPEFFTTQEALRIQGRGKMTDASAAAIILQSFLNSREAQ